MQRQKSAGDETAFWAAPSHFYHCRNCSFSGIQLFIVLAQQTMLSLSVKTIKTPKYYKMCDT